ncbi:response regulator [Accumulibacter sp.]|uniref:response regulator transcription factor n=1 Tax=Accumulibacter sp. TaxID=2053492 RepID=UPI0025D1735B|nr:response regulator [Accumulibacter sp.]MCM8610555.1 response regulator [Accumulibacter sp.]MCM8634455.1 response regulator [Accumulibacter sp.]MCM8641753.1 response regulator [Accumulibacter sp.]
MQAGGKCFLVVEDDPAFSRVLTRGLRSRGFAVTLVTTAAQALPVAREVAPDCVILDLKLGSDSALPLIRPLRALSAATRICLLTGFASIATAIEAIKLGAHHYLAKPVHIDEILATLGCAAAANSPVEQPSLALRGRQHTLDDVEWRHILKTLRDCDGNISRAALALDMHRRTLQRKLAARNRGDRGAALSRVLRPPAKRLPP